MSEVDIVHKMWTQMIFSNVIYISDILLITRFFLYRIVDHPLTLADRWFIGADRRSDRCKAVRRT